MKIKPKKALLNLPTVLTFDDYHEINLATDMFNELVCGQKIKAKEIGYCGGGYNAIFYLKQDKEFQALRKQLMADIKEEEECDY